MDIHLSQIVVRLPGASAPLFRIPELIVRSGERVLIQGPSGSGKTTLLHLIGGLFPSDEGQVKVGGQNMAELSDAAKSRFRRKHLGMVFQKLNLLDHLTCEENVSLALQPETRLKETPNGKVDRRPWEALNRIGLSLRAKDRASVMSLGEQQRVAVARVVAQEPDIVLADEPTSSLDAANAKLVLDALTLLRPGSTVVMVSHDQRISDRFDRVISFEGLLAK